jgi:hypothetical protein
MAQPCRICYEFAPEGLICEFYDDRHSKVIRSRAPGFGVAPDCRRRAAFTQTHTHDPSQSLSSTATLNLLAKAPADRKAPTDNSPSNCAFCQAIAHAGIFFTPATLPLLPALSAECEATAVAASVLAGAVFRYWQSRAPPQR